MQTQEVWQDSFTDTNGTQLIAHTPELGNGYSLVSGTAANVTIQSNAATMPTVGTNNTRIALDDLIVTDFVLRYRARAQGSTNNSYIAFVFNIPSTGSEFVLWLVRKADSFAQVEQYNEDFSNYEFSELTIDWPPNTWIDVEWVRQGDKLLLRLDGEEVMSWVAHYSGVCTVETIWQRVAATVVEVDDLVIEAIEFFPLEVGMIYNEHVRFWVPREGAERLAAAVKSAWCTGCPAGVSEGVPAATDPVMALTLALVTNNPPLSSALTYADLTFSEAVGGEPVTLNDETPPAYCLGMIEGPGLGGDGEWRLVIDQQIWEYASGTGAPVFAVALLADDDTIIGYAQLATGPAAFEEVGDIIKITGDLLFLPQMPPAP